VVVIQREITEMVIMKTGNQNFYCANCGGKQYSNKLNTHHVMSMLCSDECRKAYGMKCVRMIMGKDEDEEKDTSREKQRSSFATEPQAETYLKK
jgi:hypothetical protein